MEWLAGAYDVIVVGGGAAGICAALQSARAGASTLLVEKNGLLGGTMTAGGVSFPGLFWAWGQQIIAGVGWELVERTLAEMGAELPPYEDLNLPHPRHQVPLEAPLLVALADELLLEAGCTILLHTMLADVCWDGECWQATLCCKEGLRGVSARAMVDATGDANAVRLAGGTLHQHEALQPGTIIMKVEGYDREALDYAAIASAFEGAASEGHVKWSDVGSHSPQAVEHLLRVGGGNCTHVVGVDGETSLGRTEAELEAHRLVLRLYRFFRGQPGLEGFRVVWCAPECGIRETVTIDGIATITLADYVGGRIWPDAVCYGFYPIDLHDVAGDGVRPEPLAFGTVPTIPRGALIPRGLPNLVVGGRCIASDRYANSACRVQATCMATGQAAGATAALVADSGLATADVPMNDLRALLCEHGAILPLPS
jgi:ribulose 1,5-bisphosphate synthetase/thiazole synthase